MRSKSSQDFVNRDIMTITNIELPRQRKSRIRRSSTTKKSKSAESAESAENNTNSLEPIEKYLKSFKCIWFPIVEGHEKLARELQENGHRVILGEDDGSQFDFLSQKTKKRFDVILCSPSIKHRAEFLLRAFELKKPFAFLVPLSTIKIPSIKTLFKENPDRLTIVMPNSATSCSVWILHGIDCIPSIVWV